MSAIILEEILQLAKQLTPDERSLLVERLQSEPKPRKIVQLGATWTEYVGSDSDALDFDAIEAVLNEEKQKWMNRLFRQIDGDFSEDNDSNG